MNRKTFIAIALATLMLGMTGCEVKRSTPKKRTQISKTYTAEADPFCRISIESLADVSYRQDSVARVIVKGSRKAVGATTISNKDEQLIIGYKTSHKLTRISDDDVLKIEICSPDLIEVEMRGAGSFKSEMPIDTDTLRIFMKGAGTISLDSIICDQLHAELKGAGTLRVGPVKAQNSSLILRGVGTMDGRFNDSGTVDCVLRGVGTIKLAGTAKHVSQSIKGTGTINTSDLKCTDEQ